MITFKGQEGSSLTSILQARCGQQEVAKDMAQCTPVCKRCRTKIMLAIVRHCRQAGTEQHRLDLQLLSVSAMPPRQDFVAGRRQVHHFDNSRQGRYKTGTCFLVTPSPPSSPFGTSNVELTKYQPHC